MTCLACFQPVDPGKTYHEKCLKDFWQGEEPLLQLDYASTHIDQLAKENVLQRITVTGVQPKLSLGYKEGTSENNRLTIVDALNGRYILKPPFKTYPEMPQVEALSMHLANACGISTVPFILIPLKDGELAYLTRRIDRTPNGSKLAMEDACQFTERLTEHKYKGSYEQIANAMKLYAYNPLIDIVRFYEQVLVSYLIGNNDMHLKNFSLIANNVNRYQLTPVYDMISAQLLVDDREELALSLNGKRNKITLRDFEAAMIGGAIPKKAIQNTFQRIEVGMKSWPELIENSFLSDGLKQRFTNLISQKASALKFEFNSQQS